MPKIINLKASVLILIGIPSLKWINRGADLNCFFNSLKASNAFRSSLSSFNSSYFYLQPPLAALRLRSVTLFKGAVI